MKRIVKVYNHQGQLIQEYKGSVTINRYLDNGISLTVDNYGLILINAIIIIEDEGI